MGRGRCRVTVVFLAGMLAVAGGWKGTAQQVVAQATTASAQGVTAQAPGGPPGTRTGPKSPERGADGSVTFRLAAPRASSVAVSGDWQEQGARPLAMAKGEDGVWQLNVAGLTPELRTYTFVVDGVRMLDPGNADVLRNGLRFLSALLVPGKGSALYAVTGVPHGSLRQVWYASPSLGMKQRRMTVYTPSGYDGGTRRYPVLYLLHGGGGDEEEWNTMGRESEVLDNLIAAGQAAPMIVVMPNGDANQTAAPGVAEQLPPTAAVSGSAEGGTALGIVQMRFAPSIVPDIVPFVDRNFRTLADRDHRAIAGLSVGGAQSVYTGLNHLETFSYVAMFSAGLPLLPGALKVVPVAPGGHLRGPGIGQELNLTGIAKDFPEATAGVNARLHLLYISCGEDDGLLTANREFMEWLTGRGVAYKSMLLPGYAHEWTFWRLSLVDLAPRLFR